MSRSRLTLSLCLLLAVFGALPSVAAGDPQLVLVLDASGSMWGQVQGENKIVVARRVLDELIESLPAESKVGLVAYGHRREGDCSDVEVLAPAGPLDRKVLTSRIDGLTPKGKTPLTAALEKAFDEAGRLSGGATVVLVSDGLETCGGDPCAVVRKARAANAGLVVHVVGFGVEESDVSSLECTAQAGGGLYLAAADAAQLSAAFARVVEAPPELPAGRLEIGARVGDRLVDALVRVRDSSGKEVATGRTYTRSDTNPRIFALPDGVYDVEVSAVGIQGSKTQTFEGVEIRDGVAAARQADFGTGELFLTVTRNGQLSDAAVRVYKAGTQDEVAAGRTYSNPKSNPKSFRLSPGEYDVFVSSVELADRPERRLAGIAVTGGGRAERKLDLPSGELAVGAVRGGTPVDAVIQVYAADGKRSIASGRTYDSPDTNPRRFVLSPGHYRVEVRSIDLEGKPKRELSVEVQAGGAKEVNAEF
ncbi:MAG: VWA domain-containing protein [Acidobacteria bacterium]|nr:VWA domain-containing protein [Acidobacteriota bacterium]